MADVNITEKWFVSARDKTDNKKLFGFSFARLMEAGGATLRDGIHELYIYKCEDRVRLESSSYLKLPSSARDTSVQISSTPNSPGAFSRSSKESVYIHTLLCSTKLTQNGKSFVHQLVRDILFWEFLFKINPFTRNQYQLFAPILYRLVPPPIDTLLVCVSIHLYCILYVFLHLVFPLIIYSVSLFLKFWNGSFSCSLLTHVGRVAQSV